MPRFAELPQKNLAVELLRKLLNDEIKTRTRKNLVQVPLFRRDAGKSDPRLPEPRHRDRPNHRGTDPTSPRRCGKPTSAAKTSDLTEDELAFYDALETNDSAVKVLGDATLRTIAQELVQTVKQNVTIDWTVKETVRAKLRVMVKRILRKYGYPPDKQEKATETVLKQAELLCADWAT